MYFVLFTKNGQPIQSKDNYMLVNNGLSSFSIKDIVSKSQKAKVLLKDNEADAYIICTGTLTKYNTLSKSIKLEYEE